MEQTVRAPNLARYTNADLAGYHATGRRLRSLPMTPDKVLDALHQPA